MEALFNVAFNLNETDVKGWVDFYVYCIYHLQMFMASYYMTAVLVKSHKIGG